MSKSLGFSIGFKFSMYGELVGADLRHATSLGEGGRLQSKDFHLPHPLKAEARCNILQF